MDKNVLGTMLLIASKIKNIYEKLIFLELEDVEISKINEYALLKFLVSYENEIYEKIPFEKLASYSKYMEEQYVLSYNFFDHLLLNDFLSVENRVYSHLNSRLQKENIYNDGHLFSINKEKAYAFVSLESYFEAVFLFLPGYLERDKEVYICLKYHLAFLFPTMEDRYLFQNYQNKFFSRSELLNFTNLDGDAFYGKRDKELYSILMELLSFYEDASTDYFKSKCFFTERKLLDLFVRILFFEIHDTELKETLLSLLENKTALFQIYHKPDLFSNVIVEIKEDEKNSLKI